MQEASTSGLASYWSALFGYALGTAQVLVLDWFKTRVTHRKHLRLLRAELRRVGSFDSKYDWKGQIPFGPTVRFPQPPSVSPAYVDTVTATDFVLTDEFEDDNSQEALLLLLDGCARLQRYSDSVHQLLEEVNTAPTQAEQRHAAQAAVALAERYDHDFERLRTIVQDSLREVDRRLSAAKLWPQIRRIFRRNLPASPGSPDLKDQETHIGAGGPVAKRRLPRT